MSLLLVCDAFGQNDNQIFTEVDQMPRFPECKNTESSETEFRTCTNQKLLEFIHSNLEYPEAAKKNKVEGAVVIQFVVDESGEVKNGKVLRDINGYFEASILSVIEGMPIWIPGKEEGKLVKVLYTVPIVFRLPSESDKSELNDLSSPTNIVVEEIVREFAPDFEMTMEDGSKKKLSDFKGQVVYVSFWASWCGPCIKGFNNYREIRKNMEDLGVILLNVSIDKDAEEWKAAIEKHQPTGMHALVPHSEVREPYQIYNVPRYEIIGKNGQFLYLSDEKDRDILENFKEFISN